MTNGLAEPPPTTDTLPSLFVVDDEAALTQALCSTLRAEGYETIGFTSAHAAMAALPDRRCDLLLVDLNMPEMLGIDLLRSALQFDPSIVGVIMTGEATVTKAVEAMKAGALDFILKPFNLSAILPVLARALHVRRLRLENAQLQRRTREHAEKLQEANRQLEAANKELAAFSHSVSHDLRGPLRTIDAMASLLLKSYSAILPAEGQRFLTTMNLSVRRMNQLIDDLLRLSSLGHQALHPEQVDIAAMAQQVLDQLREEHPTREVGVRIGDLPQAVGDPALLNQVLVNLLSNAYKFTRRQDHALIEVGVQAADDGTPVYFVRDNGAGFDMAYAKRLFGVFQRLHRAEEYEGTGVGLSIVQRIIERHHGRIWAEAAVGRGATFFFTLNLQQPTTEPPGRDVAPSTTSPEIRPAADAPQPSSAA